MAAADMAQNQDQKNEPDLEGDFEIEAEGEIREPAKLLNELKHRYQMKKLIYRESKQCYFDMDLFLFFIPILIAQAVTNVLTHVSMRDDFDHHSSAKIAVTALNGLISLWTAGQLKMGWSEKTRQSNSTLMKYRSTGREVDFIHLIFNSNIERTASSKYLINFVEKCHEHEKSILDSNTPVAWFIYRKYKKRSPQSTDDEPDYTKGARQKLRSVNRKKSKTVTIDPIRKKSSSVVGVENNSQQLLFVSSPKSSSVSYSGYNLPSDDNINAEFLFKQLKSRYYRMKHLYYRASKYYYYLNLVCFYAPLLLCSILNTIISALVVDQQHANASMTIIIITSIASVLTGVQMKLLWASESVKCEEARVMYQKLESQVVYRLLLCEQGARVRNVAMFAYQCDQIESQTMDSVPPIPDFIYRKWGDDKSINEDDITDQATPSTTRMAQTSLLNKR